MADVTSIQFMLNALDGSQKHVVSNNTLVGREVECSIHIPSPQISRYHAKLFMKGGQLYVRDLESSNGTFVNGTRIEEPTAIQFGDQVAFYNKVFRVTSMAGGRSDATIINHSKSQTIPFHTPHFPDFPEELDEIDELLEDLSDGGNTDSENLEVDSEVKPEPDSVSEHEDFDEDSATVFLSHNQKSFISTLNTSILNEKGSGPRLIVLTAPLRGKCYPLTSDEDFFTWSIGRNEHAEIEIHDNSTSRLHAWITKMDNIYEIKEENSTNGLVINGVPKSRTILAHNDVIQVGGSFFVFRSDTHSQSETQKTPLLQTLWQNALKILAFKQERH